ncbi:Cell Wall Hydrolase [Ruminococcaceae bacterium FB2012]|nr:Cell Wall Hydrolase [Ruminococcaceae bacterium FB2012]
MKLSARQTAAVIGTAGIIAFGCSALIFGRSSINDSSELEKTVLPGVSVNRELEAVYVSKTGPSVAGPINSRSFEPLTVNGALNFADAVEEKTDTDPIAEEASEEIEDNGLGEIVISVESAEPDPEYVIDLTPEEFDMMCAVVMSEVGYCDDQLKLAIANVIINRVKSDRFPDSVYEVLHQKNQFGAIDNYYTKRLVPDESVIDCVTRALSGEGGYIVNGATFYYTPGVSSPKAAQWFESLCYCATVGNGRFFKAW